MSSMSNEAPDIKIEEPTDPHEQLEHLADLIEHANKAMQSARDYAASIAGASYANGFMAMARKLVKARDAGTTGSD